MPPPGVAQCGPLGGGSSYRNSSTRPDGSTGITRPASRAGSSVSSTAPLSQPRLTPRAGNVSRVLERVTVTGYVTPLREGGSLPGLVEADNLGTYVLKFRGAGHGSLALGAEVLTGEPAPRLGPRPPQPPPPPP